MRLGSRAAQVLQPQQQVAGGKQYIDQRENA